MPVGEPALSRSDDVVGQRASTRPAGLPALPPVPTSVAVERLLAIVAERHGIKPTRLLAFERCPARDRLRAITLFAARAITDASYPELGSAFGGRDHSTIMHAIKTVSADPDALAAAAQLAFEAACSP